MARVVEHPICPANLYGEMTLIEFMAPTRPVLSLHRLRPNRSLAACLVKHESNGRFAKGFSARRTTGFGRHAPDAAPDSGHSRFGTTVTLLSAASQREWCEKSCRSRHRRLRRDCPC